MYYFNFLTQLPFLLSLALSIRLFLPHSQSPLYFHLCGYLNIYSEYKRIYAVFVSVGLPYFP